MDKAAKELGALLLKLKPYLLEIDQQVVDTYKGEIKLTLRVWEGFVTDVVSMKVIRKTFKQQLDKVAK